MAFCSRCGVSIPENAKFCPKCGQPASAAGSPPAAPVQTCSTTPVPPVNSPAVAPAVQPNSSAAPAAGKKAVPRWAVIVLVVLLAAAAYWFFLRKDPVKDLKNFVFYDYGNVPFSAVVDTVLPGAQWSSAGSGNIHTVTVSGNYRWDPISITFQMYYAGSIPSVQFLYATLGGMRETDEYEVLHSLYELHSWSMSEPGIGRQTWWG